MNDREGRRTALGGGAGRGHHNGPNGFYPDAGENWGGSFESAVRVSSSSSVFNHGIRSGTPLTFRITILPCYVKFVGGVYPYMKRNVVFLEGERPAKKNRDRYM